MKFGLKPRRLEAATHARAVGLLEKERVKISASEDLPYLDHYAAALQAAASQYTATRIGMKLVELLGSLLSLSELELRTVQMVDDAEQAVSFIHGFFG